MVSLSVLPASYRGCTVSKHTHQSWLTLHAQETFGTGMRGFLKGPTSPMTGRRALLGSLA